MATTEPDVGRSPLVGRDLPVRLLHDWLAGRTAGTQKAGSQTAGTQTAGTQTRGPIPPAMFVRGEAGIGKTSLIRAVTATATPVRWACAVPWSPTPYGVLDQLVPGLADPSRSAALPAATVRQALLDGGTPVTVVLEDLHWADEASLELLPALIEALVADPVAVIASYRSDELPRGHPIRRLRAQLRHRDRLAELSLSPLDGAALGELMAGLLGGRPSRALTEAVADRTDGVPFFVEELLDGMDVAGWLSRQGDEVGLLNTADDPPLPESIRDAVRLRAAVLPQASSEALDAAAVVGVEFDVAAVTALTGQDWPDGLDHCGLLRPAGENRRRFRHLLTHEALYAQVPWSRRRAMHLAAADRLAAAGGAPALLARHLVAARDFERARPALIAAAEEHLRAYACRDAARLLRTALETWAPGTADSLRSDVVDRLARCAELSGDHAEAVTGLRELADLQAAGEPNPTADLARTHRRLAVQYELLGRWPPALDAREAAARAFTEAGQPAEAATDLLAIAAHLRSAAGFSAALEALDRAEESARAAEHGEDLLSRIGGLRGNVLARTGHPLQGVATVRAALDLALSRGLTAAAAEIYQRLADSLEHAGDYRAAGRIYDEAYDFCRLHDQDAAGQLCRACATVVMFHAGRWDQALKLCVGVLSDPAAAPHARAVAHGVRGLIDAMRGRTRPARADLLESRAFALRIELVAMELLSAWGLVLVDAAEGRAEQEADGYRHIVERCRQTQERHFCVPVLQFAAACFATTGAVGDLGRVTDVLADAVNTTGQPEARAALAHALGEAALLDGEPARARPHFRRALDLLDPLDLPVVTTLLRQRASAAAGAAGDGADDAGDLLRTAYRTARRLRARPLADSIDAQVQRLGTEPARPAPGLPLTTRETQVLQLVGEGLTSRQIGARLFLSSRTVDMHVRNAVARLGCRTRSEAVRRMAEIAPA